MYPGNRKTCIQAIVKRVSSTQPNRRITDFGGRRSIITTHITIMCVVRKVSFAITEDPDGLESISTYNTRINWSLTRRLMHPVELNMSSFQEGGAAVMPELGYVGNPVIFYQWPNRLLRPPLYQTSKRVPWYSKTPENGTYAGVSPSSGVDGMYIGCIAPQEAARMVLAGACLHCRGATTATTYCSLDDSTPVLTFSTTAER